MKVVELYDMWNTEDEKDVLWQCLMKYNIDNKIDKKGAIQGMHDLLSQEEENPYWLKDLKDFLRFIIIASCNLFILI